MVHVMRQRQSTTRTTEPHKRTERIIEDSELPVVQCDYFVLQAAAATFGLKVLSIYVNTLRYGMSTVVEMKSAPDALAVVWALTMLNCFQLSDIILQRDPEPSSSSGHRVSNPNDKNEQSSDVLQDAHIRATEELKIIRNSCKDSCGQCWQQCKNAHSTDRLLTVL